jgi:hypothetical protein
MYRRYKTSLTLPLVSIMYWCWRDIDHVLVWEGYRSCIGVGGVSIMYLCEGYRSCIGVGGVAIMYWCGRGIDHVLVCERYRLCIGV